MADVTTKGKWAFWAMIVAVLVFASVPSLVLVESLQEYRRALSGFSRGALKPSQTRRIPHREPDSGDDDAEIRFVEFSLAAPAARAVSLAASFNGWRPESLALKRGEDGVWRIAVPLQPGSYRYAFVVDGQWQLDPQAPARARWADREVSLRTIE